MTDQLPTIMLLAGVLIAGAVVLLVLFFKKDNSSLNRSYFQTKWLEIENSLDKNNPHTYMTAVMSADKLVDTALKQARFKGTTMGERMRSAQKTWKNTDSIWRAHKVRNQLAHEPDYRLSRETALGALSAFKQALKDLGAI